MIQSVQHTQKPTLTFVFNEGIFSFFYSHHLTYSFTSLLLTNKRCEPAGYIDRIVIPAAGGIPKNFFKMIINIGIVIIITLAYMHTSWC